MQLKPNGRMKNCDGKCRGEIYRPGMAARVAKGRDLEQMTRTGGTRWSKGWREGRGVTEGGRQRRVKMAQRLM